MSSKAASHAILVAAGLASAAAQAGIPSTSAYATDAQNEYVQDTTSDSIASLNMVLCVFGSMGAGAMVNAGPYIALVDMNKCDNKKASSVAPPTGGTHDPSNGSDAFYIGVKPTVTAPPKVIDGVIQP